jgi:basic membrane lipoprotein Med (substrate-binding protein (PBP1-ABC) superfamily)
VLVSYTGNFEDVGAAKEAALAQISRGADLLFHNADAAGLGVFQAAKERGVYAFGANRNQNDVAPGVVIASGVTDIPGAFVKIASDVKSGNFRGAMLEYGMKDHMVKVVYNPKLISAIPRDVMQRAQTAEDAISSGKIELVKASQVGAAHH